MNNQILSDPELRRFKDQISLPFIGVEGQQHFKNLRIAVVGSGGIGSSVLQLLSSIGVGHLGIIDYRLVEEKSMLCQTLFGGNDLGKLKTILSKERLQTIFPFVNYEIINLEITNENAQRIFSEFDLIVDTSNQPYTSAIIFDACLNLAIPAFFGSVSGTTGKVIKIDFKNCPNSPEFSMIFGNPHKENSIGKISLTYHFTGILICNEIVNFSMSNPKGSFIKQISFNLSDYCIKID